ncbi:MAG: bifunctional enoyl-CoA hydratase/phosphate acetyltransferase [Tissierellia bacterium]|nr:bifunctional enoyl-CoA hydratase/phosphate acetyltransferase [Tissierellia bacterium]
MKIDNLNQLLEVRHTNKMKLAVIASHDEGVLEAVVKASERGIVEPILIGDQNRTREIANQLEIKVDRYEIIHEENLERAAELGVKLIREGKADFIMKGLIDTSTLLKAVLNKEWGLRTDSLLSHVMVYEVPSYHKLIYLTDGGMNLSPSIEQKVKIIENSVIVAKALGNETVKIACLAAKEKVDLKMDATVQAMELKEKYLNGEFEDGVIVDGPMALDLAVSKDSAKIKGYRSDVAGDADVLLVPNIEMGNGIGKSITYFAGGKSAGIIMGAKVPIVLVSRADTYETKLYSIALGSIISNYIGQSN